MGDKVTSIWQRASDEGENKDQVPWHLKYGGRTLGTFAGIGKYQSANYLFHIYYNYLLHNLLNLIKNDLIFQLICSLVFGMLCL